jgi:predicted DNA-binding WGR domain protein
MRRFEMIEGTSSKFWEVVVKGAAMTVHFGRIGSAGQSKTTEFASSAEAQTAYDKLLREKVAKGYQEVGAPSSPVCPPDDKPKSAKPQSSRREGCKRPSRR